MDRSLTPIGWREWLALPDLGIAHIKAKVDTGARTSALHAFAVKPYAQHGTPRVRFSVHPWQKRRDLVAHCDAAVVDRRWVRDSGGHRERRYVIETLATLGDQQWTIELTLTDRENMLFRLLLGRGALEQRFIVVPDESYLLGPRPPLEQQHR